ncbi:MAG: hypothetical protein M0P41_04565 [Sphaerochaeta sp.]|nr:hypothetical protein [Sphaerochaeta sp.]
MAAELAPGIAVGSEESGTHPRAIQGYVSDSRGAKDTGGLLRHNNEGREGVSGGSEEGRAYASIGAEIHPEDDGVSEGEEVRLGDGVRGLLRYQGRRQRLQHAVVEGIRKSGLAKSKKADGTVCYQLDKSTPEARLASARLFHDALSAAKAGSKYGEAAILYNVETTTDDYGNVSVGYADDSIDLYLSKDLNSGYAIHRPANPGDTSSDAGNGTVIGNDLISVFSNSKASGKHYTIYSILLDAIFNGADKLDCYGKKLAEKYARMGFVPASKVKFNEAYATDAWKARHLYHVLQR